MTTSEYRKIEFKKVKTIYTEYKTKIKLVKPNGETNWLDITNDEFINIVEFLTKSKVSKNCYGEIEFNKEKEVCDDCNKEEDCLCIWDKIYAEEEEKMNKYEEWKEKETRRL